MSQLLSIKEHFINITYTTSYGELVKVAFPGIPILSPFRLFLIMIKTKVCRVSDQFKYL